MTPRADSSMNKLKELLEQKRKAAAAEAAGSKLVKRSAVEEFRLKKLRQEEDEENAEKVIQDHTLASVACMAPITHPFGHALPALPANMQYAHKLCFCRKGTSEPRLLPRARG